MKTLTVNGQTYTVADPDAAHIDDSTVSDKAWSGKNIIDRVCPGFEVSGAAVTCQPVAGYPMTVTAAQEATRIYRSGKNLFNIGILEGLTSAYSPETGELRVSKRGQAFYKEDYSVLTLKDYAPSLAVGQTYTLNAQCSHTGNFIYLTLHKKSWMFGSSLTITQEMLDSDVLWYNANTDGDTTRNIIKNVQIELGNRATAYAPYKGTESFAVGEPAPALAGDNVLWADAGDITVTGRADPTAVIEKLTNAIIALGGKI